VVDRKRAAAILTSQASLIFLVILMIDAFSFAASQLTVMHKKREVKLELLRLWSGKVVDL